MTRFFETVNSATNSKNEPLAVFKMKLFEEYVYEELPMTIENVVQDYIFEILEANSIKDIDILIQNLSDAVISSLGAEIVETVETEIVKVFMAKMNKMSRNNSFKSYSTPKTKTIGSSYNVKITGPKKSTEDHWEEEKWDKKTY